MAGSLIVFEGAALFAAVAGLIFYWGAAFVVDWPDALGVLGQALAITASCITAFYYNDLYDLRIARNFHEFAVRVAQSFGVAFLLLAAFYTLVPEAKIGRGLFASTFVVIVGLLVPLRAISYGLLRHSPFVDRVLILGMGGLAVKVVQEIEASAHLGHVVIGVTDDGSGVIDDDGPSQETLVRYPILGPLERLDKILDEARPDRIIVAVGERRGRLPLPQLLEARMKGIVVEDAVEVYERLAGKVAIESLTPSAVIFSRDFKKSRWQLAIDRMVNLTLGAIGLVASAPLLVLIAAAIKLESRGPVFFVQTRVGLRGRPFKLIKFRTMRPPAGPASEWVRDNADRVTRVGQWLRTFRLDELPQFVNILRGDLNLIGPRPHPVSNFELFLGEIPYYALRSSVRPGVTGWAQVRYGYANDLAEEIEKMRYDLYFIKHLSLTLELRILIDSVKIVLFGRGSKAADCTRVS